jgi:hypothetical protein
MLTDCQVLEIPPVELIRQHFDKRSGLLADEEEE